jgi:hypothetical protein
MTPEQMQANFAQGVPFASMGLRAFAEATCIIVRGEQVNRRRLIKYVANKLGGAHHDTKRGTDHEEHLYSLLDESRQTMQLMGKPTVYFELLSIGQALARSPDIRLLIGDPAT